MQHFKDLASYTDFSFFQSGLEFIESYSSLDSGPRKPGKAYAYSHNPPGLPFICIVLED